MPYGITQCYLSPDTSEHTPVVVVNIVVVVVVVVVVVRQVKIGDRLLGRAGCLLYPDGRHAGSEDGSNNFVPIIVIVGTVGVSIIVVLVVIVARVFLLYRRRVDDDRRPLDPRQVSPAHLAMAIAILATLIHDLLFLPISTIESRVS